MLSSVVTSRADHKIAIDSDQQTLIRYTGSADASSSRASLERKPTVQIDHAPYIIN